jgi:ABC-type lipoprotein release transport system permease subunit
MGGAVGYIAWAQARRRGRALAVLAVFIGIVGGVAMSLVAGARRSSTVVDRYFATSIPYDLELYAPSLDGGELRAIPNVERADVSAYLGGVYVGLDGTTGSIPRGINGIVFEPDSVDPTIQVLDGRTPEPAEPTEVAVNQAFVREFGLGVGDDVTMRMFATDQYDDVTAGRYDPRGPRYTMHITGVVRTPPDIAVDEVEAPGRSAYGTTNTMFVQSSFYEGHRQEFLDFGAAYDVELVDSDLVPEFRRSVTELTNGSDEAPVFGPARFSERRDALDSPVGLETTALLLLGVLAAACGAVAAGLLLRAEQRWHDAEIGRLRALGSTAPQLGMIAALRTVPVAVGAALLAAGVTVTLSGRYPVGIGRQLELHPGLSVNGAVLGIGALAVVAVVLGLGFALGLPTRAREQRWRRTTVANWLAQLGAPTEVTVGTHFAFERRRGAAALPSRTTVLGGAVAVAVVVAIALFVGGIDRVYAHGGSHGFPWDAVVGNVNFSMSDEDAARIAADPLVDAATIASYGDARLDGEPFEVLAVDERGTAGPQILSGRAPASPSEIAIGAAGLRALHHRVGDTVTFSLVGSDFDQGAATGTVELTVVGVSLAPVFGEADLGETAVVTLDAIAAAGGDTTPKIVLTRVRGDDPQAVVSQLDREYTEEIVTDIKPSRIVNLHRVRALPTVGMVLAGLMGAVVLLYTLATGVRGRTGELALLRALGLPPRRLLSVLAWQGVALATAALLVGIPLGIVLGSSVWRDVARQLGVDTTPVLTLFLPTLVPLAALAVAVLASVIPAARARRQPISRLLRAE